MVMKMPLSPQIGFRIDPETKEKLEHYAKKEDRDLSNYLRLIVKQHLTMLDRESQSSDFDRNDKLNHERR